MYSNIVVIVTCFVASVMLFLLISFYLYIAIVQRVVPIFVNTPYKSPLLLILLLLMTVMTKDNDDMRKKKKSRQLNEQ